MPRRGEQQARDGKPDAAFALNRPRVPEPSDLARPYYLAELPVTNAIYRRFVSETGQRQPGGVVMDIYRCMHEGDTWDLDAFAGNDLPVTGVDDGDITAFCAWLSERRGPDLPRAHHQRVRVRQPRRHRLPLLVGATSGRAPHELRAVSHRPSGACRLLSGQPVGVSRPARKRLGVLRRPRLVHGHGVGVQLPAGPHRRRRMGELQPGAEPDAPAEHRLPPGVRRRRGGTARRIGAGRTAHPGDGGRRSRPGHPGAGGHGRRSYRPGAGRDQRRQHARHPRRRLGAQRQALDRPGKDVAAVPAARRNEVSAPRRHAAGGARPRLGRRPLSHRRSAVRSGADRAAPLHRRLGLGRGVRSARARPAGPPVFVRARPGGARRRTPAIDHVRIPGRRPDPRGLAGRLRAGSGVDQDTG